jgi:sigma-B regulation protein RsbU (phosphoserine phosphatase)
MFASHAILSEGPAAAVTVMNRALCRRGLESRFVTLMFGVVTPDGEMTYCNAGHNPPMVIGPNGVKRLDVGGPVVGLLEFAPYDQETVRLEPGDTIVIFSDGVSEALNSNGDEFGDDRLQAVVEPARKLPASEIVDRLVAAVREFTRGAPQSDDITAMAVRYLGNAR